MPPQQTIRIHQASPGYWYLLAGAATYPVVVGAVHVPGHAEVPNFHQQVLPHQAVPGGQVTVHKVLGRQVDHACCNLLCDMQHLRLRQLAGRVALCHQHRIRPMCPVREHKGWNLSWKTGRTLSFHSVAGAGGHSRLR